MRLLLLYILHAYYFLLVCLIKSLAKQNSVTQSVQKLVACLRSPSEDSC